MKSQTFSHERLKEARESSGWSQETLVSELYAHGVQISRATWVRYENGDTEPDISDLLIIAKVLKKPLEFFLSNE